MASRSFRRDGLTVEVADGDVGRAVRELGRRCHGLVCEVKRRRFFVSKSERRRRKIKTSTAGRWSAKETENA